GRGPRALAQGRRWIDRHPSPRRRSRWSTTVAAGTRWPPIKRQAQRKYADAHPLSIRATQAFAYSWLPAMGLNLIPRNATPSGFGFAASTIIAVQMIFVDVAAIAVVPESMLTPWATVPIPVKDKTKCVTIVMVARWAMGKMALDTREL